MTGLNDKSAELIELLTATNTKLDAVADLLTAMAPPEPLDISSLVSVLGDIHTDTMSMDGKLLDMKSDLHQTYTGVYIGHEIMTSILLALIPGETPVMQPIAVMLDDMRRNNLNQMQGIIQAIILAACPCAETPLYLPPPPDTTPFPGTDSDKCKRVQKVLAVFTAYIDNVANISSIGAGLTQPGLAAAITAACATGGITGAEVGVLAGPPGAIIGALIGALSLALAAIGSALMSTLSIQWHTAPLISQIQTALFNADNAADGSDAFQSIVDGSDVVSWYWVPVINYMWWSAWADLIYDDSIELDLTGFDGTLCGEETGGGEWLDCVEVESLATVQTDPNSSTHNVYDADLNSIPSTTVDYTMVYSGGTISFSNAIVGIRDWNGTSFEVVSGTGVRVVWTNANGGTIAAHDLIPGDPPWVLTETTYALLVDDAAGGSTHGAFVVSICPPA